MTISPRDFFISAIGGMVGYQSEETGELLFELPVPAGKILCREYVDMCPPDAKMVTDGLEVFRPRSGVGVIDYGAARYESGANPDFVPTSASTMEAQLRLLTNRLQQVERRESARQRALDRAKRKRPDLVESLPPASPALELNPEKPDEVK